MKKPSTPAALPGALDLALHYAKADPKQLAAIARQEHRSAENWRRIACAIVDAIGAPVTVRKDLDAYAQHELILMFNGEKLPTVSTRVAP